MLPTVLILLGAFVGSRTPAFVVRADTLHLHVGSPQVDLSTLNPHYARVTVERFIDGSWREVSSWTNRLELGDSAGRPVHRWTTIGTTKRQEGEPLTWQLYQTFDNKTLTQFGLRRTSSDGGEVQLTYEGAHVHGMRKAAGSGAVTPIDVKLSRQGFPMAATDLVPSGVALRDGLVMTIPAWQNGMTDVETHILTVIGRKEIQIAGKPWKTWAVEERSVADGKIKFIGTWYLADVPPYMVYAEVEGPNGTRQRMTEVLVDESRPLRER